jgi:hypothetical protein
LNIQAGQSHARAFSAGSDAIDILPRITAANYFLRWHYEIPLLLIRGNDEAGSLSDCNTSHRNANAGIYNEHQVVLPGYGRWGLLALCFYSSSLPGQSRWQRIAAVAGAWIFSRCGVVYARRNAVGVELSRSCRTKRIAV